MRVNPSQPTFGNYGGVPLRLEIAARIVQAWNSDPKNLKASLGAGSEWLSSEDVNFICIRSLKWADSLIQCHNETCEAKNVVDQKL